MSVIITEDRIKKILSNREKMLNDINKKMVLLFREEAGVTWGCLWMSL